MENNLFLHCINKIPNIGPQKISMLLSYFETALDIWNCDNYSTFITAGLNEKNAKAFIAHKNKINPEREQKILNKYKITVLSPTHKKYPQTIKKTLKHPPILYTRGNLDILKNPSITIVGSRKISNYGQQVSNRITKDLSSYQINIVSGLALGIDSETHKSLISLYPTNASAIAVLGGGIDDKTIAPRTNFNLAMKILDSSGLIMSSFTPFTKPSRGTFPARNTLMAAISKVTIIIEANKNSGSLVTAELAHKFNKKIFAVPGSIFSENSLGTNSLIKTQKADIFLDSEEILNYLKLKNQAKKSINLTNEIQKIIYEILLKNPEGLNADKIIIYSKKPSSKINSSLTLMEINGTIKKLDSGLYTIS